LQTSRSTVFAQAEIARLEELRVEAVEERFEAIWRSEAPCAHRWLEALVGSTGSAMRMRDS